MARQRAAAAVERWATRRAERCPQQGGAVMALPVGQEAPREAVLRAGEVPAGEKTAPHLVYSS